MKTYAEGDLVATVSTHNNVGGYSYYGTTLYQAVRLKNGKLVWHRHTMLSDTTAGMSGKVIQRAKDYASQAGLEYRKYVRHNQAVAAV